MSCYFSCSKWMVPNWMFHNFHIISHFPDFTTRLLLNVSHFPDNFAVSRLFRISQIWKWGLTYSDVSHFPDCFTVSRLFRIFQKFLNFARISQIPVSRSQHIDLHFISYLPIHQWIRQCSVFPMTDFKFSQINCFALGNLPLSLSYWNPGRTGKYHSKNIP